MPSATELIDDLGASPCNSDDLEEGFESWSPDRDLQTLEREPSIWPLDSPSLIGGAIPMPTKLLEAAVTVRSGNFNPRPSQGLPAKHTLEALVREPTDCGSRQGEPRQRGGKAENTRLKKEPGTPCSSENKDLQEVEQGIHFETKTSYASRASTDSLGSSSRIITLGSLVANRREEIESHEASHEKNCMHTIAHKAEWAGMVAFLTASSVMLVLWVRHVHEESFVTTFFVTAIACGAYLTKASIGDFRINGVNVPVARYLDWLTTTPLMLYEVCHIGHAPTHTTLMIIGSDIAMLSFGIIAALVNWKRQRLKHVWFFVSSCFYVLMLVTLHVDVGNGSALEQPEKVQILFRRLEVLTTITWSFYPVVVLLGRAHFKVITRAMEDVLLIFLDIVAKIGMEGLIVASCASGCVGTDDGH